MAPVTDYCCYVWQNICADIATQKKALRQIIEINGTGHSQGSNESTAKDIRKC
jgi:hypothetical protein